jgi:hypothetical protein
MEKILRSKKHLKGAPKYEIMAEDLEIGSKEEPYLYPPSNKKHEIKNGKNKAILELH